MKHYYRQLGVSYSATMQEIESAYQRELDALKCLPSDDQDYIKEKRARLKEAYYAILLHHEMGQKPPDTVIGDAEAIEKLLVQARLEKSGTPKNVKIKGKNKGNPMLAFVFIVAIFIIAELIPVDRFEPEQYVYLSQYEQVQEKDAYIAEVAEASKVYIEVYAKDHQKEYAQGGTGKYEGRKTDKMMMKFLETYWGAESFEEVTDYLCDMYTGYTCDSSYDVGIEDAVYAFYGFMPYTDIIGYRNPFTGSVIEKDYHLYLYYIQFYEAYENGEVTIP